MFLSKFLPAATRALAPAPARARGIVISRITTSLGGMARTAVHGPPSALASAAGGPTPVHFQCGVSPASTRLAADDVRASGSAVFHLTATERELKIVWGDGHMSVFDYLWLRDNCQCPLCHHSSAQERMFDTSTMPLDISAHTVDVTPDGQSVRVVWPNHESVFESEWLRAHCYTVPASGYPGKQVVWGSADMAGGLPEVQYGSIMGGNAGVKTWLSLLDKYGFTIVRGVPLKLGEVERVARRVGFLKETFWGPLWSVKSTPDPMNLSLTGAELKAHTDFTWSETPPGLQFLHCLEFSQVPNSGGESTLIDGLKVAQVLRERDFKAYETLTTTRLPFSFMGPNQSYVFRGPMIQLDEKNMVVGVRHNQANRAPLDVPPHMVREVYRSIQKFQQVVADPTVELKFLLKPGDLLVFNNRRLLHGRKAYDASVIQRHLEGCYIDFEEYACRRALLDTPNAA